MTFVSLAASLAAAAPSVALLHLPCALLLVASGHAFPQASVLGEDGQAAGEAPGASESAFEERMASYEARRLVLDHAFDNGRGPFPSEDAAALLAEVQADQEVPSWYAGEIAALARSFELVDGLGEPARAQLVATLGALPEPGSPPAEMISALVASAAQLASVLGPNHPSVAQRYFYISNLSGRAGDWEEALGFAIAAVVSAEGLEGERGAQTALRRMWLGSIYRRLNRLEEAEAALLEARATLDRLGAYELGVWMKPRVHVDNYIGNLYTSQGRLDEAEPFIKSFVERAGLVFGRRSSAAIAGLNNLGQIYTKMGLHERAQAVLSRCVEFAEAVIPPGNPELGRYLYSLGTAERQTGRLESAKEHLKRAVAIIEPQALLREVGIHARLDLAQIARLEGDGPAAVEWADAAMADAAAVQAIVPMERVRVYHMLISEMCSAGLTERARSYMADYEAFGEDMAPYRTEFYRIQLDEPSADDGENRKRFEALIAGLDAEEGWGMTWRSGARELYARYLRRSGALLESKRWLVEAAAVHEESRGKRAEGFGRSAYRISPQPCLALVNFELGDFSAALEALEAWRGRSLHDLIEAAGDGHRASLRSKLAATERLLRALEEGPSTDREEVASGAGDAAREALAEERDQLRNELALGLAANYSEPSTLDELRAALLPGELYVGWTLATFDGEQALLAWTLGQDGPPKMARIEDGPAILERFRAFATGLGAEAQSVFEPDPKSVEAEARALGDILFGLVQGGESAPQHLKVVPGQLDGLPFEALRPAGEWAGSRWTLSHAPSATLHALLRSRTSRPPFLGSVLCVGDPLLREEPGLGTFLEGESTDEAFVKGQPVAVVRSRTNISNLRAVPESGVEARSIAAMYPRSLVLTGKAASEQALSVVGAEYSVIHIASHAVIGGRDPHGTGIVLTQVDLPDPFAQALLGKRPIDGFLSVPEIASEWKIDADLVTLSACRSALGTSVRGEGYVGLSSALFQAGAGAVLASLWEVQDKPTRLFMEAFYREWRALSKDQPVPRAKAIALGRARTYLREFEVGGQRPFAHPAFWSAFVLIGNPD